MFSFSELLLKMVIKNVLLSGTLKNNRMECFVDPSHCNLQGTWQLSLDSVTVMARNDNIDTPTKKDKMLNCSASLGLSWIKSVQLNEKGQSDFLSTPLSILRLFQTRVLEQLQPTVSRARHWHTFQNGTQRVVIDFKVLSVSMSDTDKKKFGPVNLNIDCHILLLLEKLEPL
jgi:hypothetical protein